MTIDNDGGIVAGESYDVVGRDRPGVGTRGSDRSDGLHGPPGVGCGCAATVVLSLMLLIVGFAVLFVLALQGYF